MVMMIMFYIEAINVKHINTVNTDYTGLF